MHRGVDAINYKVRRLLLIRTVIASQALGLKWTFKEAESVVGDINEARLHIESGFKDGMTWENKSKTWEFDHRIPFNSATNYEEFIKLCHYSNVQPLFKLEHWRKGIKIPVDS